MLIIADVADARLGPRMKALLEKRRDEMLSDGIEFGDIARWLIIEPGDAIPEIETATGFPIGAWEWVHDHGGVFEAPIILSDDGFGIVLIVPDNEGVAPELLDLLRRGASTES